MLPEETSVPYARLSVAEKEIRQREDMREPAVRCPSCDTQTTSNDLVQHVEERCQGPREPHPQSRWITFADAMKLGVQRGTLSKWVRKGRVRVRAAGEQRQYLLRDLAVRLAERRREFPSGNRPRLAEGSTLPVPPRRRR